MIVAVLLLSVACMQIAVFNVLKKNPANEKKINESLKKWLKLHPKHAKFLKRLEREYSKF